MHVKIVSLPAGMEELDLSIQIPLITQKMSSSDGQGGIWISLGDEEDIKMLADKGIVLEKVIPGK